jgi:hypothetical protein
MAATGITQKTKGSHLNLALLFQRLQLRLQSLHSFLEVFCLLERTDTRLPCIGTILNHAFLLRHPNLELGRHLGYAILLESKVGFETFDAVLMDTDLLRAMSDAALKLLDLLLQFAG